MTRLSISSGKLILLVSFFIAIANNQLFLSKLAGRVDLASLSGAGFALAVYLVVIFVLALILFLFGQRYLLKPLAIILLLFAAVLSYFTQNLGVLFDVDMIRNTAETIRDNNQQEAIELLSFPLIKHVFIYGILPALFVWWVKVDYKPFFKEQFARLGYLLGLLVLIALVVMLNFKFITYFARENRDLRVYITPVYAIDSIKGYIRSELKKYRAPLRVITDDAVQQKKGDRPTVGIMVVGETSRAMNYSLNGYPRETNPELKKEDVINYSQATSCGTSTAYSVPCMFSFLARGDYSPTKAAGQTNSLDALVKAGVKVVWIDNNSSCKGVCERIGEINIRQNPDPESAFFDDGQEFDEGLLKRVVEVVKGTDQNTDILVVLHILGSHGPKYYKRYPDKFSRFEPACKKATPQECTDKEIINAYDNTVLYTDHVLSQLINYLKGLGNVNTFMIYASDHGESLGENGVYLHGLPYFLAPKEQTRVGMVSWFSDNFLKDHQLDKTKIMAKGGTQVSHDNLSHTLLGAYNVRSHVYQKDLDLLR